MTCCDLQNQDRVFTRHRIDRGIDVDADANRHSRGSFSTGGADLGGLEAIPSKRRTQSATSLQVRALLEENVLLYFTGVV